MVLPFCRGWVESKSEGEKARCQAVSGKGDRVLMLWTYFLELEIRTTLILE